MRRRQTRAHRSRLRVIEAALESFADHGFSATTLRSIASAAGVSVGLTCRYFPTKEHLALAIYARLADELTDRLHELPEGSVAERFATVMGWKLELVTRHRQALVALAAQAIDPDARAGVFGEAAAPVRARVTALLAVVVREAKDAPDDPDRLVRALYAAHLGLILLWLQEPDAATTDLVTMAEDAARLAPAMLAFAPPSMSAGLERVLGRAFPSSEADSESLARRILERVFARRRLFEGTDTEPSEASLALHVPRVRAAIEAAQPITLVLPAFPAKSPSPAKVLGARPDAAEALALENLSGLLDEIEALYGGGVELVICSDGAVFADAVGVTDEDVLAYRRDLQAMLDAMGESRISLFDLADAFGALEPDEARAALLEGYAMEVAEVRARAKRFDAHRRQLDGIHRFLFEDRRALDTSGASKSQLRKAARTDAYEVVRRSDAWGRLLATVFPDALRLSIHPQPDVSPKIGLHMLATEDAWLTPWHGCAVLETVAGDARYSLMKRSDAERRGAVVVEEDGRPSYLEIAQ